MVKDTSPAVSEIPLRASCPVNVKLPLAADTEKALVKLAACPVRLNESLFAAITYAGSNSAL